LEVWHELWGIMLEAFPSRQEFLTLLEEMRAFREDSNRRFEELRADMNRRFEAADRRAEELRADMNRRFEAVDRHFEPIDHQLELLLAEQQALGKQQRELNLHMSSLGSHVGHGLEQIIKEVVEEFAGQTFPFAERLVLRDEAGEVFGVPGAEVEFEQRLRELGIRYRVGIAA
ncbi:MAG: hypothetical protein ACREQ3_27785, partial [Candidatus Binatia bacterium]